MAAAVVVRGAHRHIKRFCI